jgi:PAS domain S-box-containing protein
MPIACITWSPEFRVTSWNPAAEKTFGYAANEAVGKHPYALIVPKDAETRVENVWLRLLAGDASAHSVNENQTRDGRTILCEWTNTPLRGADGSVLGVLSMAQDVSARKQAEAELAYERDLLKTLLDNISVAIYFKDRQSRFVRYSKSFSQLFRLSSSDALQGKTDLDFFTEAHARPAYEDEQEIIRTGMPIVGKMEKETHLDGRVTWALTNKLPWRDKNGNIIGTFGVSQNITAIKEAEAKLEAAHKQLVEVSRRAGMAEVATSVLHNVGNVLNSVNICSTLLADRLKKSKVANLSKVVALLREQEADLAGFFASNPKGKQLVAYLAQLAEHLTAEQSAAINELQELASDIDHIKDIVAMQQNYAGVSGVAEGVRVCDLVEDALRINASGLTRHDVETVREYDPQVPEMSLDKHKVLQILVNLISNAKCAFDESGRTDKRLTVRVANGCGRVKISVMDNGVGIPCENLTRIFRFGFTTRKNGHGFGLHSGALAAHELGGALLAHSDGLGQGATFTLELPLSQNS